MGEAETVAYTKQHILTPHHRMLQPQQAERGDGAAGAAGLGLRGSKKAGLAGRISYNWQSC